MLTALCTALATLWLVPGLVLAVPIDDFEGAGREWVFLHGPEFPGATGSFEVVEGSGVDDSNCGRLSFDFTGGGAYVQATVPLPSDPPLAAVDLTIRKTVANHLTVRVVDESSQTFQKSFNFPARDWQRVRVKLDTGTFHWGGAGDGVFHGAPQALGILVERSPMSTGFIDIDNLVGVPRTEGTAMAVSLPEYTVVDFGEQGSVLRYDFAAGGRQPVVGTDVSLLGRPQTLRLAVESDGSGHEIAVTLHSHFQSFRRIVGRLDIRGEAVFEAPVASVDSWEHFGGENDGIVRPPLRFGSVSLERVEGGRPSGEVKLLRLSVVTEVPANAALFPLATSFLSDDGPTFRLTVTSLAPEELMAEVACVVTDFGGRVVSQQTHNLPMLPLSQPGTLQVPVGDVADFAEMAFHITAPGQRPVSATATYTAPLPAAPTAAQATLDPDSLFGMGLYLYRYPGSPEGLAQMDQAAALAERAGIKWSREEFLWHRIEPEEGRFEWDYYDTVVDTATRHGISIYGLIDYWSDWTDAYTSQGVDDYVRYCRALVEHYKNRIKHWEIWNEPNIFFWSGDKELYFELLDKAYEAIKETDPEAFVFGCSTAGIDTAFIQRTMDAGARFDGLTIHPYRGALDDMAFIEELRAAQELVGGRPVWITEMGWPTHVNGGVSEREQAALLARCYIDAVASGACGNVSWYDFREDGANPYYNEHHFGIVRHDFGLKPAYRAAATVCNMLAGLTRESVERTDDGLMVCRFAGDGREVVAVWPTDQARLVTIGAEPDSFEVRDLMGRSLPTIPLAGRKVVAAAANEPMLIALAQPGAEVGVSDVAVEVTPPVVRPGGEATIACSHSGGSPEELPLLDANLPVGWASVEGRDRTSLVLRLPDAAEPGGYTLAVTLASGGSSLVVPVRIDVAAELVEI